MSWLRLREQRGDTIVEVLIVIAIVSLVLGGAFASARESLISTQRSQERGEALKLLEQQVELLKAVADRSDSRVFSPSLTGSFCLELNLDLVTPECMQGTDSRYKLAITRLDPPATRSFRATATWERAGGGSDDNITIFYNVHPRREL